MGLIILSISCNKIPPKSVFETLSVEELSVVINNDDRFEDFYKGYWDKYNSSIKSLDNIDKAKFLDVTYRDLYGCYLLEKNEKLIETLNKEWNSKFGGYISVFDSIIDFWLDYKREHSLDKYVKVEFDDLFFSTYSERQYFYFNLIPLCETIEEVHFSFLYIDDYSRLTGNTYWNVYDIVFSDTLSGRNRYEWLQPYYEEKIRYYSKERFISSKKPHIELNSVTINSVKYDYSKIPESIHDYLLASEYSPFLESEFKDIVISEELNSEYVNVDLFITGKIEELKRKKYPRVCDYYNFINSRR